MSLIHNWFYLCGYDVLSIWTVGLHLSLILIHGCGFGSNEVNSNPV